ncbi:MAG TPA: MFS transporter [Sulfuricurvum sp.]|nr:MFS transporter [Sulfuricurvum sp.]
MSLIDSRSSRLKAVTHGFFLSITTTIAEPAIILPLILHFFGASSLIIGLLSSLLKGGAIIVQLFAAFSAQSYTRVMPHLRFVFLARFLSWFGIGAGIYVFGATNPSWALWCIGIGLFVFSFAAGFGSIYFNEILGKVFSHRYRGRVFAQRQFAAGVGALISGVSAGIILEFTPAPYSFAYLFMFSAFVMLLGVVPYALIEEPIKDNITVKEPHFYTFLRNSFALLRSDGQLRRQIRTYLLAYSHLFSLPFIILHAQSVLHLGGVQIGYLLTSQVIGGMLSNLLWGKLSANGKIRLIITVSFAAYISANTLTLFADQLWHYALLFFLLGAGMDGMRLAFSNNILIIAPEHLRPVYLALQSNITSIGLFFAVPGAIILEMYGFSVLVGFTIVMLLGGMVAARRLTD